MCPFCRKLLQTAQDRLVIDVWTQNTAPDYTPSGFWKQVFGNGAMDVAFPTMNVTGSFSNATLLMVSLLDVSVIHAGSRLSR